MARFPRMSTLVAHHPILRRFHCFPSGGAQDEGKANQSKRRRIAALKKEQKPPRIASDGCKAERSSIEQVLHASKSSGSCSAARNSLPYRTTSLKSGSSLN